MRVVHLGPDPSFSGGISSVIHTFVSMSDSIVQSEAVSTWLPEWSTGKALRKVCEFGVKHVFSRHPADVVHIHLSEGGSFVREGALAMLLIRVRRTPIVVSLHGARFEEFSKAHPRLTRWVLTRATLVHCLGPRTRELVSAIDSSIDTVIIVNPIDASKQDSPSPSDDENHSLAVRSRTVIFAGEIGERKGWDLLADAWVLVKGAVPDARLVACGPIPAGTTPDLTWCEYKGVLGPNELAELYRNASISCLPSRAEVLPMFLLESMSRGLVATVTNVGEVETFADCPGVDVVDLNAESVAESIIDFMHLSKVDLDSLSRANRRWCEEHADVQHVKKKLWLSYLRIGAHS